MGQATLDLPDPLEQPPETAAGTDDLLAQLAGNEIDRMLAEADETPAAVLTSEVGAPPPEPLLPDTAPAAVQERPAAAQLGDFLSQVATERPDDVPRPETKPTPPQSKEAVSPREAALNKLVAEVDSFEQDASLAAAERGALKTAEDKALDDTIAAVPAARDELAGSRTPIFLRVLACMNSPLDSLSDDARDLVGKIAILTMVNALSVLVYVLFFRRHG